MTNPLRGMPGHPSHPPLTDVTVGAYTVATIAAILSKAGVAEGGFALLTAGGTMGGSITYVHGMRVLNLVDEPTARAIVPSTHAEKERAEA